MFINPVDRYNEMIFNCLDDMVAPDNPVRILDKLIDITIEKYHAKYSYKGTGAIGRPAYSPATMLKTVLYGLMNGISSIKRLENELYINLELIWLTGNLRPDYNTISAFRKNSATLIIQFCHDLKKTVQSDFEKVKKQIMDVSNFNKNSSIKVLPSGIILQITKAENILMQTVRKTKSAKKKSSGQIILI